MNIESVPFNQHLGLELEIRDGHESVRLQPQPEHLNHFGALHAGVLFTVAETASALCLLARFREMSENFDVVLRTSSVKYRNPAFETVHGTATIDPAKATAFETRLVNRGMGLVPVDVTVTSGGKEILRGTFDWFARRRDLPDSEE